MRPDKLHLLPDEPLEEERPPQRPYTRQGSLDQGELRGLVPLWLRHIKSLDQTTGKFSLAGEAGERDCLEAGVWSSVNKDKYKTCSSSGLEQNRAQQVKGSKAPFSARHRRRQRGGCRGGACSAVVSAALCCPGPVSALPPCFPHLPSLPRPNPPSLEQRSGNPGGGGSLPGLSACSRGRAGQSVCWAPEAGARLRAGRSAQLPE